LSASTMVRRGSIWTEATGESFSPKSTKDIIIDKLGAAELRGSAAVILDCLALPGSSVEPVHVGVIMDCDVEPALVLHGRLEVGAFEGRGY
jgi:hypothetical protein